MFSDEEHKLNVIFWKWPTAVCQIWLVIRSFKWNKRATLRRHARRVHFKLKNLGPYTLGKLKKKVEKYDFFLALKGHKSVRTLCDGPETPTEWKSDSVTNQRTDLLTGPTVKSALRPPPTAQAENEKSALFPGKRAEISFSALRKSFKKSAPPQKKNLPLPQKISTDFYWLSTNFYQLYADSYWLSTDSLLNL